MMQFNTQLNWVIDNDYPWISQQTEEDGLYNLVADPTGGDDFWILSPHGGTCTHEPSARVTTWRSLTLNTLQLPDPPNGNTSVYYRFSYPDMPDASSLPSVHVI